MNRRVVATLIVNGTSVEELPVVSRQPSAVSRRPDVRHAFAHLQVNEHCGFSHLLPCKGLTLADGPVAICVEVRDGAGQLQILGPVEVTLQDRAAYDPRRLSSEQEAWLYHDRIEFSRSDEAFAEHLRMRADIQAGDTVLEIGCGAGRTARHLAPRCRKWIGIDNREEVLKTARAQIADLFNVDLIQTNGYDLSVLPDRSVDVVYCSLIFMLLSEWDRFNYVREAHRVLKPNGRLYVDTMNLLGEEAWAIFLKLSRVSPHERPVNFCRTATPQELETYFMRAGFGGIEVVSGTLLVECIARKT